MSRRLVRVVLVIAVVAFAFLFGAGARQAWSANQARGRFDAAHSAAQDAIVRATRAGLLTSELAPFRLRERSIASAKSPSSLSFWSPGADTFFNRQAEAYHRLSVDVASAQQRITRNTRSQAAQLLRVLRSRIVAARALAIDVKEQEATITRESAALQAGTLPRQFRSVSATTHAQIAHLTGTIAQRTQYVNSIVSQASGSLSAVLQRSDAEVASADAKISLLSLLTNRSERYRAAIGSLNAAVHRQTSARGAAAFEWNLDHEVATLSADYNKSMPAKMIVVSTESQSANMYENGAQVYSSPVTTGGPELPTDHGVFHIYMKVSPFVFHSPWPPSSPYYYPPTPINYWMPFDGAEGLHDASWRSNFGPGSNLEPTDLGTGRTILGTHGCVNLPMAAAQFVWDWAPVGTTVVVT